MSFFALNYLHDINWFSEGSHAPMRFHLKGINFYNRRRGVLKSVFVIAPVSDVVEGIQFKSSATVIQVKLIDHLRGDQYDRYRLHQQWVPLTLLASSPRLKSTFPLYSVHLFLSTISGLLKVECFPVDFISMQGTTSSSCVSPVVFSLQQGTTRSSEAELSNVSSFLECPK
ncbi:hypothetical protein CEXT_149131 [Caerostris extrusa]|uniref:Uncharacterized protein n=1 Tax=Caerostris extrusa TaxID=172846 RepID=A0AAV4TU43_CAEEX|nr:hypothetical protein CEXT_149131 [Caerostris extrusa]